MRSKVLMMGACGVLASVGMGADVAYAQTWAPNAFDTPANAKLWNPAKIKLMQGGKVVGGTVRVGDVEATRRDWNQVESNPVRCPDAEAAERMRTAIEQARDARDSIGGVVEVRATGVPAGWGDPTMDKLDARLGAAMLSIPATKGVEIGGGFEMARRRGSETNDVFDGERYASNFAGGIAGGISNGNEVVVRVAVRPATSIGQPQVMARREGGTETVTIEGRHDPCICPRVVPVAEAMLAVTLMDAWLHQRALRGRDR